MLRLNKAPVSWLPGLILGAVLFLSLAHSASAQSIVVMVNGDPVTSYELAQRQKFMALHGVGEKIRARLQSDSTKEAYRAFMMKERPTSQAEAQELQKKFVMQVQQNVLAEAGGSMRAKALEELIDEKLMLQAARDQKITVTDNEVDEMLTRMAQAGERKLSLQEFLGQLSSQGINPNTLKARIKAQHAWRQVIRQVYGARVNSAVSTVTSTVEGDNSATVDAQIIRLAVPAAADQNVIGKRQIEAQNIAKRFKGCAGLEAQLKGVQGATVKVMNKAKLADFRGEVRAAVQKAQVGQMTPPTVDNGAIEFIAICSKSVAVATGQTKKKDDPQERLQEEFQLYSRRHLKDLKDHARLDYPKNNS